MANSRGGLSKREFEAKSKGQPMPYSSKPVAKASSGSSGSGKINGQLKAAQKAYEKSLKPTAEEDAAESSLNKVVTEGVMGANKIKAEPIAQTFHVGQERVLDRQIEEKTVPLKLQIATLAARRQASSNVSQARLSSIKDIMSSKSTKTSSDPEYDELRKEKLRVDIDKAKKKGSGGTKSTTSDWVKVTTEKGPTGRVRSIIERNKKTGETRRTAVK